MLETAIVLIVGFALGYGGGERTAASGFWDITLSGITRFSLLARCAPSPGPLSPTVRRVGALSKIAV